MIDNHNTDIKHALTIETWTPPEVTPPEDPNWEQVFDTCTAQQRPNVANAWWWAINRALEGQRVLNRKEMVRRNRRMVKKTLPIVNEAFFRGELLKGTAQGLSEAVLDQHQTGSKLTQESQDLLTSCWLASTDAKQSISTLYARVSNQTPSQMAVQVYPLMLTDIIIDTIEEHGLDKDPDCLEAGVVASVKAGLLANSLRDGENKARTCAPLRAWYDFAARCANGENTSGLLPDTLAHVRQTPATIAVKAMTAILAATKSGIGPKNIDALAGDTVLNARQAYSSNFYWPLEQYIPALAGFWLSARTLEMPYTEALKTAEKMGNITTATDSLPTNLASPT